MSVRNKDFYAADYERLEEENESLRAKLAGYERLAESFRQAINRRVKVENKLIEAKNGLTREECVALALELGTPVAETMVKS